VSEAIAASLSLDEVVSHAVRERAVRGAQRSGHDLARRRRGHFALRSLNYSSLLEEGEELGELDPPR
jgi:hypothetical protein